MKKIPVLLACLYSLLFIAAVCFVFYGGQTKYITHVYLIGLMLMLPFIFAAIYFQRERSYNGLISGREAVREGLIFTVTATVILIVFQAVFYQISFHDFKVNFIREAGMVSLKQDLSLGKFKEADIPAIIEKHVEGVTLFKEITAVIFKTLFYGIFSSFISSLILKRNL